jgi:hypothetical protein
MTAMELGPCQEWTGYRRKNGYGSLGVGGRRGVYAHRHAWETANGPIPKGMHVMHLCDNPPCVRVEHLRLGTHAENMRDMAMKGRGGDPGLKGSRVGTSKLTEREVVQIRGLLARGRETHLAIAKAFGVSEDTISLINLRKAWRHVE